ncbi:hypothetical protein KP509_29G058900 [Ceratopteris richardii]|uniref:Uncharacterized protein n=1 Tax=Ceratopteris richardii TaxID=49495 RepID=A0A8T2R932_CERRI|nr:hypothetical protein KP509_29G058900 [Ceratopteris richardii]
MCRISLYRIYKAWSEGSEPRCFTFHRGHYYGVLYARSLYERHFGNDGCLVLFPCT